MSVFTGCARYSQLPAGTVREIGSAIVDNQGVVVSPLEEAAELFEL